MKRIPFFIFTAAVLVCAWILCRTVAFRPEAIMLVAVAYVMCSSAAIGLIEAARQGKPFIYEAPKEGILEMFSEALSVSYVMLVVFVWFIAKFGFDCNAFQAAVIALTGVSIGYLSGGIYLFCLTREEQEAEEANKSIGAKTTA